MLLPALGILVTPPPPKQSPTTLGSPGQLWDPLTISASAGRATLYQIMARHCRAHCPEQPWRLGPVSSFSGRFHLEKSEIFPWVSTSTQGVTASFITRTQICYLHSINGTDILQVHQMSKKKASQPKVLEPEREGQENRNRDSISVRGHSAGGRDRQTF